MILREYKGLRPVFAPTARAAETVVITGAVTLGENVSVWYGSVLRGDDGPIAVGDNTNIQDNCVLHGPNVVVGKNVMVGHGAIIHGCTVGDNCLIGMGATLLNRCVIGEGSVIGAGALIPEDKVIPPGSMVLGVPGKVLRPATEQELQRCQRGVAEYVRYAEEQLDLLIEKEIDPQ